MPPIFHTTPWRAFKNTGVLFAGQFKYKFANQESGKAYLALFTCAVSQAVYLDLIKNMETHTFKRCLKGLIARRQNPKLMISGNAKISKQQQIGWKTFNRMLISTQCQQNYRYNEDSVCQDAHGGENSMREWLNWQRMYYQSHLEDPDNPLSNWKDLF